MSRLGTFGLSLWIVLATSASVAHAAADVWDGIGANPPNGIWGTGANWADNSTPGNGDTATFNLANTYTTTFNANPLTIQALTVSAGNVTFASGGLAQTLSVTSAVGGGGQDVSITGATTALTLGTSGNPLHLTAGDDLSVQGGATLNIRFGSDVQAIDIPGTGLTGTIDVDGTGSNLTLTGAGLYAIARTGAGNLVVQNSANGNIAGGLGVSVSPGLAGSVSVLSGGDLTLGGDLLIAAQDQVGQSGSVAINGIGSELVLSGAAAITVGSATNGTGAIDIGTTSTGGTLTTVTGTLTINNTGAVTIGNGANTGRLFAGGDVTINGGTLTRGNDGSVFDMAPGKTMTIQNGGSANFTGFFAAAQGAAYLVTGAGSTWANSSQLRVGNNDSGTLTIGAGGSVLSAGGIIDASFGSTGTVTVTGASSNWNNTSALTVANDGSGSLTIEAGGSVSNTVAYIGDRFGSTGTVTVTGASSTWTNSSQLTVGNDGTGTLTIEAGGSVSNTDGSIGGNFASTGTVTVTGPGSKWTNNGNLTVGSSGTGTLTMTGGGEVVVGGSLLANASGRVQLLGGKLTAKQFGAGGLNALDWRSGTLRLTASSGLTVGAGGLFGASLALDAGKHLEVDHTLTINSGAELFASGGLSAGALVNNGDLILSSTTVSGSVTHAAGANITAIGGVIFNDLVSGPGGFYGPGTITFAGGMSPGASPANVSFEGSLALADTNTLFIEIGGTTPGSQYDRLSIAGSASLDGTLDVTLINGFTPSGGQQFTILTAGSVANNGFILSGPAASSFNLLVNSTSVILQAIGLAGDYNQNNVVDAADYTVWRNSLGQVGGGLAADGNASGTIDAGDYDVWKMHFGEAAGSGNGSAGASTSPVPEPAGLALVLCALVDLALALASRTRISDT